MKITFVLPGVGGGGPRVIAEYAKGLLDRGHDVRILYPARSGVREILRGVYLRMRYRDGFNNKSGYTMLGKFPGETVPYRILTPELVGRNDVVIAIDSDCVMAVARLPAFCGLKIGNFHGFPLPELPDEERIVNEAWKLPMPKIVVASRIEREMRRRGVNDPICIVHNGVDRSEYYPSVPDEARSGIGTVFWNRYSKGPELALSVFERIYKLRPQTRLAMFSGYPRPAGLPEGTQFVRLPSLSVARDIYSRAAVWFCASRSEGFPGVVLEAMACGCAMVSTNCCGTDDQIDDGVSGYLTPVDDAEQMVERIVRLLDDPGLRQRFVAASQAKLAQFTWPNAVRNFEAALTDIVSKSEMTCPPVSATSTTQEPSRGMAAKVSVIVPCFNHARFLDESINSILGQSYMNLEVIIVDDCSTDGSWQEIEKFASRDPRVKGLRHQQNEGLSRSRNDGLRAASGDFIAFCDSDDVWERDKLTAELALLQNNPDYGVVYSDARIIDGQGQPTGKRFSELFPLPAHASGWLFSELAKRNFVNIQSVVMRKECVRRVGLFDEGVEWVQDWWYWLQLAREYRFLYCEAPLGRYRIHSGSTNLVHQRAYSVNRLKVFRRILKNYEEICPSDKAEIVYGMGVDLCRLGKYRSGRRFFGTTMRLARRDPGLFSRFCKALVRLCLCTVRS